MNLQQLLDKKKDVQVKQLLKFSKTESSFTNTINLNPRHVVTAPAGRVILSLDYKNQEVYVASVESGDKSMLQCFSTSVPDTILHEGIEYSNPDKDMHTLTAATCCYPELFKGKEKWEWDSIARNPDLIKGKGNARDRGKLTSFGIIYGQTAKKMAELNYLPVDVCEQWIKNHRKQYAAFHSWFSYNQKLAEARGWARNADGRIRWCNESNANDSSIGSSTGRIGVNFKIQGVCSSMIKLALINLYKALKGTEARLIGLVHDEIIIESPGTWELDPIKTKMHNGCISPAFIVSKEAKEYAQLAAKVMIEAEEYYFKLIRPELTDLKGLVDYNIAPFWKH